MLRDVIALITCDRTLFFRNLYENFNRIRNDILIEYYNLLTLNLTLSLFILLANHSTGLSIFSLLSGIPPGHGFVFYTIYLYCHAKKCSLILLGYFFYAFL